MYIVRASSSSFNNLFPILNYVRVHIRGVAHRSIICFNRRSSSYNISHAGESINQVTLLFNILNMMQTATKVTGPTTILLFNLKFALIS